MIGTQLRPTEIRSWRGRGTLLGMRPRVHAAITMPAFNLLPAKAERRQALEQPAAAP